ncbi:MAG: OmpA family protein [Gammaproteobacteria bacterium]|nr:OmpA family protein [Gammaproteobacteria bacterium]NIR81818.1 OmpA family protein [Gammaproteobacteria bacterium]NIR88650.1 OmpA family protein [Gammaproteobacteria bacterium]NIU02926.1 OmpA family protein [Gammaproteobacteria bacterium]NIV50447.1 OmpA family protein [Gammaproteobacteria bacterium]
MPRRREQPWGFNVWPAFTDVLGGVVVVLIFLITVFVIGEVLISREAMTKDTAISQLAGIVQYMEDLLGAGEEERQRLQRRVGELETDLAQRERALADARRELSELRTERARVANEMQSLEGDTERLREELISRERSYQQLAAAKERTERLSAETRRELASLEVRVTALAAELERLNRALYGARERLAESQRTLRAREAEVAASDQRAAELDAALARKDAALQRQASKLTEQATRIEELDRLIKSRLVERVEELEKYASDFFGRLRTVFADNPDIKIVGDRFVFQSEVLFPSGAAELSLQGRKDLNKFVGVYDEVEEQLPPDLPVIIEVQGHTDRVPIHNERFRSNWELSTARALGVVDYLIEQGLPPERLAAVGMGQYHPIDPADTPAAYRKNRRIELKITSR